ncbi:nuclear transport factor 2 family protein [Winogradskyella sp. UBA3174]|uniref:nuclear transport factor 2 family protein n=1 Tax=Winogradskyella sp. UBA3174 TaxID=1947785 RepID=UPI0025F5D5A7|nr:nuclear transport factor 2 family protein [Winogradskyella sp. UBA3174]|tara:strand:+ start:76632 stop:77042 length:411 start_codon:yes stop_codon:yes gene_type:complete
MSAKELVKEFYGSDLANDSSVVAKYFHKDCELHWSSSQGFSILNYNDIVHFFEGTRQSYNSIRFEFTHLLEVDATVTTRHTLFASTIENPENEVVLAHFSTIWEIINNKLYRGYEISQQADENNGKSLNSYSERKI